MQRAELQQLALAQAGHERIWTYSREDNTRFVSREWIISRDRLRELWRAVGRLRRRLWGGRMKSCHRVIGFGGRRVRRRLSGGLGLFGSGRKKQIPHLLAKREGVRDDRASGLARERRAGGRDAEILPWFLHSAGRAHK